MRGKIALVLFLPLLAALLGGVAFAWEGRMGGMGDPYGLVSDESDYLILPSKIADGKGVEYYATGRFLYHDVTDWNWSGKLAGAIQIGNLRLGGVDADGKWSSSGNLFDYSTTIGAAFPAGAGRMGIFFNYTGRRGDFTGNQNLFGGITFDDGTSDTLSARSRYSMDNSLDNFNLRVIYGQPIGCDLQAGGEIQIAYQQDQNKTFNSLRGVSVNGVPLDGVNLSWDQQNDFLGELFPFMMPYDSSYWEILFKGGLEGKVGPAWLGMDVRGGPIFGGDNKWSYGEAFSVTSGDTSVIAENGFKLKGDVSGWRVGGDVWVRYPCTETVSLPFSLRVDYREKTRDGDGVGDTLFGISTGQISFVALGNPLWQYSNTEKNFDLEVGGGVDIQVTKDTKVAAGLYYDFIQSKEQLSLGVDTGLFVNATDTLVLNLTDGEFPQITENLVKFKLAAEKNLASWVLRGGFTAFGGAVTEDYSATFYTPQLSGVRLLSNHASIDGTTWGILGSIGASTKIQGFTIEPFIQAGYQQYSVDGPGKTDIIGLIDIPWALTKDKDEALVGAGFSITF